MFTGDEIEVSMSVKASALDLIGILAFASAFVAPYFL